MRRLLLLALGAAFVVMLFAPPAGAHAALDEVSPAPNSMLSLPPTELRLRFSESVQAPPDSIRCFDTRGKRLETGDPAVAGTTVRTPISIPGSGGYVCTWRVTSDDGHAVTGATTFIIGSGDAAVLDDLAARMLARVASDPAVSGALTVASVITFGGLALVIGSAFFVTVAVPAWRTRERTRVLLISGWLATVLGTLGTLLLDGPYVAGRGLGAMLDASVVANTLDGRVGQAAVARLVLAGAAALLIRSLIGRHEPPGAWKPAAGVVAALLALSVGATGHTATEGWPGLWVAIATVHALAMAVWLGGLVLLVAEAMPGGDTEADLATALRRFSPIATVGVAVLALTGVLQSFREVATLDALLNTTYGYLLIAKVGAFCAALIVAFQVRRRVFARSEPEPAAGVPSGDAPVATRRRAPVRAWLGFECAFAVLALALATALGATTPAKTDYAHQGSSAFVSTSKFDFDISLSAATQLGRQLHVLVLDPKTGQPAKTEQLRAQWSIGDLGPIPTNLIEIAPGHYVSGAVNLPGRGDWTLTLRARTSDFDEVAAITKMRVG